MHTYSQMAGSGRLLNEVSLLRIEKGWKDATKMERWSGTARGWRI
jgi:hypothetical protein